MEEDTHRDSLLPQGSAIRDPQVELRALHDVVGALQNLPDNDLRERVLQAAAVFFRLTLGGSHEGRRARPEAWSPNPAQKQLPNEGGLDQGHAGQPDAVFSEDRTISAKDFLIQKQPQTEVERVACLAYYLTNYRDTPYFKTIDISSLNIEAAQPKFVNASQAVENALKTHYLAAASKGTKQLSGAGEVFVQALPDRAAARAAMASVRPRRRKRTGQQTAGTEDTSAEQ